MCNARQSYKVLGASTPQYAHCEFELSVVRKGFSKGTNCTVHTYDAEECRVRLGYESIVISDRYNVYVYLKTNQ